MSHLADKLRELGRKLWPEGTKVLAEVADEADRLERRVCTIEESREDPNEEMGKVILHATMAIHFPSSAWPKDMSQHQLVRDVAALRGSLEQALLDRDQARSELARIKERMAEVLKEESE